MGFRVNSCCCFTLRTGSLILGWLGTIGGVLLTLRAIGMLAAAKPTLDAINQRDISHNRQPMPDQEYSSALLTMLSGGAIVLIGGLISIIFSVLLIIGVNKERQKYIKAYVIAQIVQLVIQTIFHLFVAITYFRYGLSGEGTTTIFSIILGVALSLYFICVVHSHRLEIMERPKHGAQQQL